MAEVYISNEAYNSLLLKYIFRSGMGQNNLDKQNQKKGGGQLFIMTSLVRRGSNNINFPVNVLNFNSIS